MQLEATSIFVEPHKTENGSIQRQRGGRKPRVLTSKTPPKRKVDSAGKFAKYMANNRRKYRWVAAMNYAGVFPGKANAKDGKLYFDPNSSKDGGETSARAAGIIFKKKYLVGYKSYKIFVHVGPHSSEQGLTATLRHEHEHVLHHKATRRHKKAITAKNMELYKIVTSWKWWKRDAARKKLTSKAAMGTKVGSKLKKTFGADVSKMANTEVLAHTAAFGDIFKTAPVASAQQLIPLVVVSLLKLAFSYDQASPGAKRLGIKRVIDPIKNYPDFVLFMKKVWPELQKAKRSITTTTKFLDNLKADPTFASHLTRWKKPKKIRKRAGKRRR